MNRTQPRLPRKSRTTLSLSRDAVVYLKSYQAQKNQASLSSAVEALIEEQKQREAGEKLAAQTRAYYDSLTSSEQEESEAWGKFAESESANSEA
jgi:hypothetical protein